MRTLRWLLVPFALLVAAAPAAADNNKPKKGRAHQLPPSDDAPGAPADAAAEAELDAMTDRSSIGLVVLARPDGTHVVDLEGRFMSVAVAGPTGGATCHTGGAVKKARKAKAPAKAKAKAPAKAKPAAIPTINGLEVM